MSEIVLIVGTGPGLSTSIAKLCASKNMKVILTARNIDKLDDLKKEINATTIACDSSNIESVQKLFKEVDKIGVPNLVIYNPSMRIKGAITELDPNKCSKTSDVYSFLSFI